MPASVRLTGQQNRDEQFLVAGSSPSDARFGPPAKSMRKVNGRWIYKFDRQYAVDFARMLREAGARPGGNPLWLTAHAFDEAGQVLDPEELNTIPIQVNVTPEVAQALDGTWRSVPARHKTHAGWFIHYSLWFNGEPVNGSVQGRTEPEVIEKLFGLDVPLYRAIVDKLPIVEAPTAAPAPTVAADLSGVQPMTRKEYFAIPIAVMQRRYATDPAFRRSVDLMLKKEREAQAAALREAENV